MKTCSLMRSAVTWSVAAMVGLVAVACVAGCKRSGPATTSTTSSGMKSIAERAEFLHEYVTFRRTYETLDFDIAYRNNGGGVPAPSEWDVRLVATVPNTEVSAWIPAGVPASAIADAAWLESVPTELDLSGVDEWYADGNRLIGVDRDKRIVVYRIWSE